MKYDIPFNRVSIVGQEIELVRQAAEDGHLAGDGPFARRCEALIEGAVGAKRALLTTSCTHALELAALLLDIAPGDEVIVPSFTFVSTAGAFALRGAQIVFADVRADTLNIDERQVAALVTNRTRAIVPVHYAGVGCEMDTILDIARRHGVSVVEDNAHGLYGTYRERFLGTFGSVATQSFHETKNVTCGEGGALLVNDENLVARAEVIRDKGTNRKAFFRGEVDKYTWIDAGSSYVLSELQSAFLAGQLERAAWIQEQRRRIWQTYADGLADWARTTGTTLPYVPDHCGQSYHMFYVLLPSLAARSALIAHLKAQGILAVFHYGPLHLSAMGKRFGRSDLGCPVTEDVADRLLRLPFYSALTTDDQTRVIDAIVDAQIM
jgi:dTDP-4-amino-4,6-dideoxygalactose transaminase